MISTCALGYLAPRPASAAKEQELSGPAAPDPSADQAASIAALLADGEFASPLWTWVEPTGLLRRALIGTYYRRLTETAFTLGRVIASSDRRTAAIFLDCARNDAPVRTCEQILYRSATGTATGRLEAVTQLRAERRPTSAYLEVMAAIDPHGHLLRHIGEHADRTGLPVTATIVAGQIPEFFAQAGYRVDAEFELLDGPGLLQLIRDPIRRPERGG